MSDDVIVAGASMTTGEAVARVLDAREAQDAAIAQAEIADAEIAGAAPVRTRARPAPVQPVATDGPALQDRKAEAKAKAKAKEEAKAKPEMGTLASVMAEVSRLHGPNVIRPARQALSTFKHIPTNIFTLDMALHGGIPESLITVAIGWQSSGKTTTAMRAVAAAQARYPDRTVVFVDVEGTFDPVWATSHGVDIDRLILVQPENGEQAVDVVDAVIRASDTSMVVLDSIPALVPMKELEKSAEDAIVALQARLTGNLVRKVTQATLDERKKGHLVTVLLINQWRNKIAMMGDPRNEPGGNALRFFKAVQFEMMNKEVMGKDDFGNEIVDHNEHSFKITKNKIGNGIRSGEFTLIRNPSDPLGVGFIDEGETVLVYAKRFGVFTGAGSSWRLDDVPHRFSRIKGEDSAVSYLYENPDYYESLRTRLICMQRANNGLQADGWF